MALLIQDTRDKTYKWYRSNKAHVQDTIYQLDSVDDLAYVQVALYRRDLEDGAISELNLTPHGILGMNTTWSLQHQVFEKVTITYYQDNRCLRIQLHAKKHSKGENADFFLGLAVGSDAPTIFTSSFQVCSKVKGLTVKQVEQYIPQYSQWRKDVEKALKSGAFLIPVLHRNVFQPLHEIAKQQRMEARSTDVTSETSLLGKRERETTAEDNRIVKMALLAGETLQFQCDQELQVYGLGNEASFPEVDLSNVEMDDKFLPEVEENGASNLDIDDSTSIDLFLDDVPATEVSSQELPFDELGELTSAEFASDDLDSVFGFDFGL